MKYLADVSTLELLEDRCTGCGMCTTVCPHAVMVIENGKAFVNDLDACMECGACAKNCPADAITVQVGVGCAQAVISSALGRKSSCCNLEDYGTGSPECGSETRKRSGTGCC